MRPKVLGRCGPQVMGQVCLRHYLQRACVLDAQKSLWPRTIVATKTKRTLLSRVVVAVVALLWPLFLYQNAAVLYLNVDVAIFCTKRFLHQPKNHGDFGATSRKLSFHKRGCFPPQKSCCPKIHIDFFRITSLSPGQMWIQVVGRFAPES